MSEWLRRQTRNLLGFACAGSNPAVDESFTRDEDTLLIQSRLIVSKDLFEEVIKKTDSVWLRIVSNYN
ncbi:hypothetical protein MTR_2g101510 [Medicago truncatula]|uniref:Uncharacterized protein n=1 Tax=Medicago truncatula TaxID=3880 RepID=G7IUP3_MEDTR|nr:hypothetical protein MTR_2g101510 [Medicago truncatula]